MNARLKSLFEDAQKLSAAEREELAQLLMATVDPPAPELEKAWAEEIADRVAAHEQGDMPARSARAVLEKYLSK